MKFRMEWDGILSKDGKFEIRAGIHVFDANDEEDALHRLYDFFQSLEFIDWDAALTNGNGFDWVASSED